jgi:hypothetical protein
MSERGARPGRTPKQKESCEPGEGQAEFRRKTLPTRNQASSPRRHLTKHDVNVSHRHNRTGGTLVRQFHRDEVGRRIDWLETTHRKTIGKQSTLFLSTNSEIYKFLKSSDATPLSGE